MISCPTWRSSGSMPGLAASIAATPASALAAPYAAAAMLESVSPACIVYSWPGTGAPVLPNVLALSVDVIS